MVADLFESERDWYENKLAENHRRLTNARVKYTDLYHALLELEDHINNDDWNRVRVSQKIRDIRQFIYPDGLE